MLRKPVSGRWVQHGDGGGREGQTSNKHTQCVWTALPGVCANSSGQNYRKSLDTGSWILTNEGAGCEEMEVSINERKGQSGGVFQAEGSRSTKFHVWLCAGSSQRLQSKFTMGNYGPPAWNSQCLNFILWACNFQIYIYIYIYIFLLFFKQQNPSYQLTFSSAESSNWLELNAESFGWRGSLMPNSVLHTHTHTYTHKHTDTHTGPGSPPRTQSFKGHGLKVLWWRQGFRKCLLGQAACLSAHKGSQF